jgi:hypothetical protein
MHCIHLHVFDEMATDCHEFCACIILLHDDETWL